MRANKIMRYEPNLWFHNVDCMHRGEEYVDSRKGH